LHFKISLKNVFLTVFKIIKGNVLYNSEDTLINTLDTKVKVLNNL